jgi:hypothetical protein
LTTVTLADPEPVLPLPAMVEVMLHLGRKYKYETGTDYGTQAVSRTDLGPRIHASDQWIRIQILLFSSLTFKMPTKN